MKQHINILTGLNEMKFYMSPKEVGNIAGEPDRVRISENRLVEVRNRFNCSRIKIERLKPLDFQPVFAESAKYIYENEKLLCISGALSLPFYVNKKKIPNTLLEGINFLNKESNSKRRFENVNAYIFNDLGLVVYSRETTDIEIGESILKISPVLAVCSEEALKRYEEYFMLREKK